jgi:hypothetical protein
MGYNFALAFYNAFQTLLLRPQNTSEVGSTGIISSPFNVREVESQCYQIQGMGRG